MPSEEVHAFVDDIIRNVGTFMMGRRLYETMAVWDTIPTDADSPAVNDYAKLWRGANKIVYSTTLSVATTADTTIERSFDAEATKLLVSKTDRDIGIGGAQLAGAAVRANIIDDYHQIIVPKLVGDGTHWLPSGVTTDLELVDMRKFENGFVHLHYKKAGSRQPSADQSQ